jgi:hypothetical protein
VGTLCSVGEESYLFTMGYVAWWDEYPGPHIPAPLEIGSCCETDMRERAKELLALTKMNWNSTEGLAPITISFARKVGMLMTELSVPYAWSRCELKHAFSIPRNR